MSAAAPNRYGKHGKWVRWRLITLHYDRAWDCAEVHGHLSLRTVYRVIEIFDSTGDVATPSGSIRVVDGSVSADQWAYVAGLINEDPSLYLDELCTLYR